MKFISKSLLLISTLLLLVRANADVMCISPDVLLGDLSLLDDGTVSIIKKGSRGVLLTGRFKCIMNEEENGFFNLPHGKVETGISKPYVQRWAGMVHHYVNGKPTGLQTRWHSNGKKLSEVDLVNGKGLMTWWHPNGQRAAQVKVYVASSGKGNVSINHGQIMAHYKMEGSYKSWYKDGNQNVIGVFNNSKLEIKNRLL